MRSGRKKLASMPVKSSLDGDMLDPPSKNSNCISGFDITHASLTSSVSLAQSLSVPFQYISPHYHRGKCYNSVEAQYLTIPANSQENRSNRSLYIGCNCVFHCRLVNRSSSEMWNLPCTLNINCHCWLHFPPSCRKLEKGRRTVFADISDRNWTLRWSGMNIAQLFIVNRSESD